ncbi:hypothetical protein PoB_002687700 [Plakobranchus ocellatus]|uniref:Uncharacterized protein n=1 Tax=Plakobranchus ocellatus TaxID=259542 RepID=A0AAV4A0J4_9GAST|nr:hypothetical protein PoB_002687700 [Plakobranchus ocellatus]
MSTVTNETSPKLLHVLKTVSTGLPTVSSLGRQLLDSTAVHLADPNQTLLSENGTLSTDTDANNGGEDKVMWLTMRLLFIAIFIVGLVLLSWGSYTLHRKCFDDNRRQNYQKALLL